MVNHKKELSFIPAGTMIRDSHRCKFLPGRIRTCREPEFRRLSWMKLYSSNNLYTTAPQKTFPLACFKAKNMLQSHASLTTQSFLKTFHRSYSVSYKHYNEGILPTSFQLQFSKSFPLSCGYSLKDSTTTIFFTFLHYLLNS